MNGSECPDHLIKAPSLWGAGCYAAIFVRALKAAMILLQNFWRDFVIFPDLWSESPHSGQRHKRPYTMWPHFGQVI
jgi:hypothetical protein